MSKEVKTYLQKIENKKNKAATVFEGSMIYTGCMTGMAVIAAGMGFLGAVSGEIALNEMREAVYQSGEFEQSIAKKSAQLVDDLANGKITLEEYKARSENLYSAEEVVDFASENEQLDSMVNAYTDAKELSEGTLMRGAPLFLASAVPGAATLTVAEILRRKYDRILKESKSPEIELSK